MVRSAVLGAHEAHEHAFRAVLNGRSVAGSGRKAVLVKLGGVLAVAVNLVVGGVHFASPLAVCASCAETIRAQRPYPRNPPTTVSR